MTDVPVKYFKLAQIPLTWETNAFYAIQIASDLFEFYLTTESGQPTKAGLARKTITFSSGDIGANEFAVGVVEIGKAFVVERLLTTTESLRFRLYKTAAQRDADEARGPGDEIIRGTEHGMIVDMLLDAETGYDWIMSPNALGSNGDVPISANAYWMVHNLKGSTQAWGISLTVLVLV